MTCPLARATTTTAGTSAWEVLIRAGDLKRQLSFLGLVRVAFPLGGVGFPAAAGPAVVYAGDMYHPSTYLHLCASA